MLNIVKRRGIQENQMALNVYVLRLHACIQACMYYKQSSHIEKHVCVCLCDYELYVRTYAGITSMSVKP